MHEVLRSLLKIFEYAAKQACKQLQCNKDKYYYSQPPLMGFTYLRLYASRLSAYTNENLGGHIYTVIKTATYLVTSLPTNLSMF